jgi:hypothetical protein
MTSSQSKSWVEYNRRVVQDTEEEFDPAAHEEGWAFLGVYMHRHFYEEERTNASSGIVSYWPFYNNDQIANKCRSFRDALLPKFERALRHLREEVVTGNIKVVRISLAIYNYELFLTFAQVFSSFLSGLGNHAVNVNINLDHFMEQRLSKYKSSMRDARNIEETEIKLIFNDSCLLHFLEPTAMVGELLLGHCTMQQIFRVIEATTVEKISCNLLEKFLSTASVTGEARGVMYALAKNTHLTCLANFDGQAITVEDPYIASRINSRLHQNQRRKFRDQLIVASRLEDRITKDLTHEVLQYMTNETTRPNTSSSSSTSAG